MFTEEKNRRNNNKNTKKFPFQVDQLSSKKNISNKKNIKNEVPGIAPDAKKIVVPSPKSSKDGFFGFFTKEKEVENKPKSKESENKDIPKKLENKAIPKEPKKELKLQEPEKSKPKEIENKNIPKESEKSEPKAPELKNNIKNQISEAKNMTNKLSSNIKNKNNKLKNLNNKNEFNKGSSDFQPRKGCKINEECKSGSCNTNPKCIENDNCKCMDNNFNRDFKNINLGNLDLNLNNSNTKYPKNADKFWGLIKHEKLQEKTITRNEFLHFLRLNDPILKKKDLVFTKYDINTIFNNTSKN